MSVKRMPAIAIFRLRMDLRLTHRAPFETEDVARPSLATLVERIRQSHERVEKADYEGVLYASSAGIC